MVVRFMYFMKLYFDAWDSKESWPKEILELKMINNLFKLQKEKQIQIYFTVDKSPLTPP